MTVRELIELLQTYPQDLRVAYRLCSEHKLLEKDEITIEKLQFARPDGWLHDMWKGIKSDQEETYLVLPGH